MARLRYAFASLVLLACAPPAKPPPPPPQSPFVVAVEGACPKLRPYRVGQTMFLVYGTYGLEEEAVPGWGAARPTGHARQAIAVIGDGRAKPAPEMTVGLPLDDGFVSGDLDLGGDSARTAWLERTERTAAKPSAGQLFETTHTGYVWRDRAWHPADRRPGSNAAPLPPIRVCGEDANAVALLATASSKSDRFIAFRCEDERKRPTGPLRLAQQKGETWREIKIPGSALFDGIVNAGILAPSDQEIWIWAYRPFGEREENAHPYLVHVRGDEVRESRAPTNEPIVSLAREDDGTLFAVSGFRTLHRRTTTTEWEALPLPHEARLLEVSATGTEAWVHGTYGQPRKHVLFTTARWRAPLACPLI